VTRVSLCGGRAGQYINGGRVTRGSGEVERSGGCWTTASHACPQATPAAVQSCCSRPSLPVPSPQPTELAALSASHSRSGLGFGGCCAAVIVVRVIHSLSPREPHLCTPAQEKRRRPAQSDGHPPSTCLRRPDARRTRAGEASQASDAPMTVARWPSALLQRSVDSAPPAPGRNGHYCSPQRRCCSRGQATWPLPPHARRSRQLCEHSRRRRAAAASPRRPTAWPQI